MMRALICLRHEVHVVTAQPVAPQALAGLPMASVHVISNSSDSAEHTIPDLGRLEARFLAYWGVPGELIATFGRLAAQVRPDVIVVSGLDVLPLLAAAGPALRIWYAADEWCWHHLSQFSLFGRDTWGELRQALIKGIYERTFSSRIDRVWVVSETDAKAMRRVAGTCNVDVVPNGIDAAAFQPVAKSRAPDSAVFWGRLDFGPNLQALEWFCARIWPLVTATRRSARLTVAGFNPGERALLLERTEGVVLKPNVPDIRSEVEQHALVVLPFVSGGGIKNKLLEAAAMGMPIVCSPRTTTGLKGNPPVWVARTPADWLSALDELWENEDGQCSLGTAARSWVVSEHTWESAARQAMAGIEATLNRRRRS